MPDATWTNDYVISVARIIAQFGLRDHEVERLQRALWGKERMLVGGGVGYYLSDVTAVIWGMRRNEPAARNV